VPVHLWVYVGTVVLIVVLPGPDTAVLTRNALAHGRATALGTVAGINVGLSVWVLATALGLASLLRASATAFDVVKLIGAVYLVWLGIQAWRDSRRPGAVTAQFGSHAPIGRRGGFRQGLVSNLANPKCAVFFTSLLPQFVAVHSAALPQILILGAIDIAINVAWQSSFSVAAARVSGTLRLPRVKAWLDRVTGTVLVGVGLWLATERR
jgi:RhtB (resistance to homoserine/threonine) family protein